MAINENEAALSRCSLAKQLEDSGRYEAARAALGELWGDLDQPPVLDGLTGYAAAEVLLRVGVLTGHLGRAQQSAASQQSAKSLIKESIAYFEVLDENDKATEATIELAHCYWREGAVKVARLMLQDVLRRVPEEKHHLRALALVWAAIIESAAGLYDAAFGLLNEAAPLLQSNQDYKLQGLFHLQLAVALMELDKSGEGGRDLQRAVREYATATSYFEKVGNLLYIGVVEGDLGFLYYESALQHGDLSALDEAQRHLARAKEIFTSLNDSGNTAQVNESLARILLIRGQTLEAERLVRQAVEILEKGGQHAALAEALRTQGVTLAKMNRQEQALAAHQRALQVAAQINTRPQHPVGLLVRAHLTVRRRIRRLLRKDDAK